ncbi:MAG: nickel-dependent lactate racemase [Candidatus Cloacimonetes bacterium]|nr:nickel-dependent lactate racemase [Candidatus Cloacimonadota bacterium]
MEKIKIDFKYGNTKKHFTIPQKNVLDILQMKDVKPEKPYKEIINESLDSPIGKSKLEDYLQENNPENIVIIVSDITRPGPFDKILETLLPRIEQMDADYQIEILIANGTHREMTEKEMRYHYGDYTVDNYPILNHDCRADDLVSLGKMESGNELKINKKVADADFIMTIGIIKPHYFAGYSGGRKSILPGISGYETIRANHSRIIHKYAKLGKLIGNKINLEMQDAADMLEVDFAINMILNRDKKIVYCFSGDITSVFRSGTQLYRKNFSLKFSEKADVIFAAVGGYPKDINFYQSQKTLNNVINLVKDGGTIVLVTASEEGIGQPELEKVLKAAASIEDLFDVKQSEIQIGGHRAFATGRLLQKADILVMSEMSDELVKDIHFEPISSFGQAFDFIKEKHGEDYKSYIVPGGSSLFAVQK